MAQKPNNPVNLSVHETADPSSISPNPDQETFGNLNDLNGSVHDDENVDVPNPGLSDAARDENVVDRQVTIANLSAG